ncbi:response regulator transcription factor [Streptomyces sp. NPDC048172]|uniref:response regulator transcription factor n=1 Tax=Streptomyces sp. NPDC048172 TaxID=3365505 RepID=UPI00371C3C96
MSGVRILVVEDEPDLRLALTTLLGRAGYEVTTAADGREGLRLLFEARPALMVLDIGLPGLNGWEVLDRTRDLTDVPVLMLTAHGSEPDRVRGLRAGADDYLPKPFGNDELLARIEALLRRRTRDADGTDGVDGTADAEAAGLVLVPERRSAVWQGAEVRLSEIEFRLLRTLVRNRGRIVTTEQLLDMVWDDPTGTGRERVKFAVLRLRRKLREAGGGGPEDPLEAVRGTGYRFRPPEG